VFAAYVKTFGFSFVLWHNKMSRKQINVIELKDGFNGSFVEKLRTTLCVYAHTHICTHTKYIFLVYITTQKCTISRL
jgi:hypothetical protein